MKFKVEKGILGAALASLVRIIPSKTTMMVATNFLFEGKDGKLKIRATDLDMFVTVDVEATEVTDGQTLVPGKTVKELVDTLPDTVISFSDEGTKYKSLMITWESGSAVLPTFDDAFPEEPAIEDGEVLPVDGKGLGNAVAIALMSITDDALRPQLNSVMLNFKEDALDVAATDSKQLVVVTIDGSFTAQQLLLPKKFAQTIKAFATEDEVTMDIRTDGHTAVVALPNAVISGTLLSGKYPDYSKVIPDPSQMQELVVPKADILGALKTVASGTNYNFVKMDLALGSVLVETENASASSRARQTIMAPYSGEPMTVGFNAEMLQSIISRMPSDEVVINIKNPRSAVLVTPSEQPKGWTVKAIAMPVAVNAS